MRRRCLIGFLILLVSVAAPGAKVRGPVMSKSAVSAQEAITARSGGTLRNDFGSTVGFKFTAAANATVTQLGRFVVSGNSGTHTVGIYNGSFTLLGSVSVATSGAAANAFKYVALATPVSISSGTSYYVMSAEVLSGDQWYDNDQTITPNASIVSGSTTAAYSTGNLNGGNSYVPVNFKFTIP